MPTTGRAVKFRGAGDVDVISVEDSVVDDPGPGHVLVEVAAAGLNRADCIQRRGLYPAPPGSPPDIPGLEFAGTVAAIGDGVALVRPGDRVMGITGGGGMATHVLAHERTLVPVPASLSLTEAAAVPEVFFTAYDALFAQAELGVGETVLIHAVGSGVGTAAVQLARLAGVITIGTSRSPAKLERCAPLGLTRGVVAEAGKPCEDVAADVVLDMVGGTYLEHDLRAIRPRGRIVLVGLLAGASATLPLGLLLYKRISIVGTTLRARPLEEKAALAREFAARIAPRFDDGALRPVIDRVLPMTEIREAHRAMEANDTFGKIVLTW